MGGTEITSPLPYEFPSLKINAIEYSLKETLSNFKVSVIKKLCDTKEISALNSIRELANSNTEISKNCSAFDYKDSSPCKGIKEVNPDTTLEIEGTPTGRKSPIIQSKKGRNQQNIKDKIKCPDDWQVFILNLLYELKKKLPTPERKSIKLSFPSPNQQKAAGRLKQSRLSLVKTKNVNTIDLTSSPECTKNLNETEIQRDAKKDIFDSDTILPSPTSGVIKLPVYKTLSKDSPNKIKRQQMSMKLDLEVAPNNTSGAGSSSDVEHSFNILQNYTKRFKSPKAFKPTYSNQNESMSLLRMKNAESSRDTRRSVDGEPSSSSPTAAATTKTAKNNQLYKVEPLFKEPSVRNKAEKRSLPGWSCDECRDFFDELYKDDPVMLARKMNECSKHRGRNNPVRPNTPGGFWEPRWDVPDDTEEFNRRNNV
ncbi:hypothetical protein KGM_206343 [Danaus plexippus plexippus]|uniref:DNA endonuclease RBBP8 n=1 Tax=Danaus plexippus plexippus TaxID=278856 RepID=A0A212EPQ3_DANPL|nr:hypothetical protein KGM_206343 [Danaus plexippus plexippus]